MIVLVIGLAGLALLGLVSGIRNLATDGYRRVPTAPVRRDAEVTGSR